MNLGAARQRPAPRKRCFHRPSAPGGIARAVPGVPGLVATFGGRWEGVPVRDLLGKSDGFPDGDPATFADYLVILGFSRRF
jgi:hypothetical protein